MSTTTIRSNNNNNSSGSNSSRNNRNQLVHDVVSSGNHHQHHIYEDFVSNESNNNASYSTRQQQQSNDRFRSNLAMRFGNNQRYQPSSGSSGCNFGGGGESSTGSIGRRSIGGVSGSCGGSYCSSTLTLRNYDLGIQRSLYGNDGVGASLSHHVTNSRSTSNRTNGSSNSVNDSTSSWSSSNNAILRKKTIPEEDSSFFLKNSLPSPPSLRLNQKQQNYNRPIFPMTSPHRRNQKTNKQHVSPPPLIPSLQSPRRFKYYNKNLEAPPYIQSSEIISSSPDRIGTTNASSYDIEEEQDENVDMNHSPYTNSVASLSPPSLKYKNDAKSSSPAFVTFDNCFYVCAYGTKKGSIVITKTHFYFCLNPPFQHFHEPEDYLDVLDDSQKNSQYEDIFFHDDIPPPTLHQDTITEETDREEEFFEEQYEEMMNKCIIRATHETARRQLQELDDTQPLPICDGMRWPISQLAEIHPRTCMMRDVALEIYFQSRDDNENGDIKNDSSINNPTITPLPKKSAFFAIPEVNHSTHNTTARTNKDDDDNNYKVDDDCDTPQLFNKPRRQIFVDMLQQYAMNMKLTYWNTPSYINDQNTCSSPQFQSNSGNPISQHQEQSSTHQTPSISAQQSYNHILLYPKNNISSPSNIYPSNNNSNAVKRRNWNFFRKKNSVDNTVSNNHHLHNLLHDITTAWTKGTLSNYDYLLRLNAMAGRTFHDPGNYPIMPWVLSNFNSATVPDLSDEQNFRDLTKPMGALCPKRLERFVEKYNNLRSSNDPPSTTPFMYGSHYSSTGGVVLHYLVRLTPFAHLHRQLQGGQFDVPDRLFKSIQNTWEMCSSTSPTEVKELTPEWYSDPGFLINQQQYNLGSTVDGQQIRDVILPPWAENSPEKFIEVMRNALESDICSASLPAWIDLIFGFKQKGIEAEKANNLFYHWSYYAPEDLAKIEDEKNREEIEHYLADFGHCPLQLFYHEHPQKKTDSVVTQSKGELRMIVASSPENSFQSPRRNFY